MQYVSIKDGRITGVFCGPALPAGCVQVKNDSNPVTGDPVTYYDKDWHRRPDMDLMREDLMPLPQGKTWADAERTSLRDKNPTERVLAGEIPVPTGQKLVDGRLVDMTLREQVDAGVISMEDVGDRVRDERQMRMNNVLPDIERYQTQAAAGIPTTSSADWYRAALLYLQALRDVPAQQGFPFDVKWPEPPVDDL